MKKVNNTVTICLQSTVFRALKGHRDRKDRKVCKAIKESEAMSGRWAKKDSWARKENRDAMDSRAPLDLPVRRVLQALRAPLYLK